MTTSVKTHSSVISYCSGLKRLFSIHMVSLWEYSCLFNSQGYERVKHRVLISFLNRWSRGSSTARSTASSREACGHATSTLFSRSCCWCSYSSFSAVNFVSFNLYSTNSQQRLFNLELT